MKRIRCLAASGDQQILSFTWRHDLPAHDRRADRDDAEGGAAKYS